MTAVALARAFSLQQFAAMSLVLTTYELVRMFIHNGVGARLVAAPEGELDEVSEAVHRINWFVGVGMFILQLLLARPLAGFYNADIATTLAVLSVVHLIYPIALTHACLAQRREQFGLIAGLMFLQITGDNLLTAVLALAGLGVWAVVVPKIVIAIAWVWGMLVMAPGWRRTTLSRGVFREVTRYALTVFMSEALNTVRINGDRMIVGKVLGADAFALYSFASNAGAGIATGLSIALSRVVLPFLAKGPAGHENVRKRFWISLKGMGAVIGPVILLQASLAPIYVPLVFGERWRPAIPVLILMCLATLARPVAVATSQMLRAVGHVSMELGISKLSTLVSFAALFVGLPFGVMGVAWSLLIATTVSTIYFAWIALQGIEEPDRKVFSFNRRVFLR
ncbi:oligosaccharide flippase family protein [Methylocystis sp. FS]|nr:oligosaccharide flippase family protein [Methylocystis silviterrae]